MPDIQELLSSDDDDDNTGNNGNANTTNSNIVQLTGASPQQEQPRRSGRASKRARSGDGGNDGGAGPSSVDAVMLDVQEVGGVLGAPSLLDCVVGMSLLSAATTASAPPADCGHCGGMHGGFEVNGL